MIEIPPPNPEKAAANVKQSASDYENDAEFAVVKIDGENNFFVNGEKMQSEQEMRNKLREAHQTTKKLMILGNGEAWHGSLVKVVDAGNDASMDEVAVAISDD